MDFKSNSFQLTLESNNYIDAINAKNVSMRGVLHTALLQVRSNSHKVRNSCHVGVLKKGALSLKN